MFFIQNSSYMKLHHTLCCMRLSWPQWVENYHNEEEDEEEEEEEEEDDDDDDDDGKEDKEET